MDVLAYGVAPVAQIGQQFGQRNLPDASWRMVDGGWLMCLQSHYCLPDKDEKFISLYV